MTQIVGYRVRTAYLVFNKIARMRNYSKKKEREREERK